MIKLFNAFKKVSPSNKLEAQRLQPNAVRRSCPLGACTFWFLRTPAQQLRIDGLSGVANASSIIEFLFAQRRSLRPLVRLLHLRSALPVPFS